MFLGATNASAVQSVVAIERTVFYRERAAGMYSELPYAFAQVSSQLSAIHVSSYLSLNPVGEPGTLRKSKVNTRKSQRMKHSVCIYIKNIYLSTQYNFPMTVGQGWIRY